MNQLKPNTYTICESTEQCKELFELAEKYNIIGEGEFYEGGETILLCSSTGFISPYYNDIDEDCNFWSKYNFIPLPEFIARLKGEWVEGKTVTLSDAEWSNVFSCLDYHGTNDTKAILIKIKEQLNNQ